LELCPACWRGSDPFSLYNYCSPEQGEHFFAGVAQLVEQLIRNQQVSGSSPLAGFFLNPSLSSSQLSSPY
jgi:hypothetical protein